MTQVLIDYAFGLVIQSGEFSVAVRVNTLFTVRDAERAGVYEPEDTTSLGALVTLHQASVKSGEVRKDGRVVLLFADGRELTVEPDDAYEAFTVTGTAPAVDPRFDTSSRFQGVAWPSSRTTDGTGARAPR